MLDYNALHNINHEQNIRWSYSLDQVRSSYLEKRGADRELQLAKAYAKGQSIKNKQRMSMNRVVSDAINKGTKTPATKGGEGVDKLVAGQPGEWSKRSVLHPDSPDLSDFDKPLPPKPSFRTYGQQQVNPPLASTLRTASKTNLKSTAFSAKGYSQPPIDASARNRATPKWSGESRSSFISGTTSHTTANGRGRSAF